MAPWATTTGSRAAQPALIKASDVKDVLREFCSDPFSSHANKRWLLDVLNVREQNRHGPEGFMRTRDALLQMFETAVDEFLQDLSGDMPTGLALSKHTLAMLALYHRILITWKTTRRGPMVMSPIFQLLANYEGTSRKQYLSLIHISEPTRRRGI